MLDTIFPDANLEDEDTRIQSQTPGILSFLQYVWYLIALIISAIFG